MERCVQCWVPQYERNMELLEWVQQTGMRGMEQLSYKERLRQVGLLGLEKRWLSGPHQCLSVSERRVPSKSQVLLGAAEQSTGDNRQRLTHGKFHMNMMANFFTVRVTEHWNRLPREAVDYPSLETFKNSLLASCAMCFRTALPEQRARTTYPRAPCQADPFCDSLTPRGGTAARRHREPGGDARQSPALSVPPPHCLPPARPQLRGPARPHPVRTARPRLRPIPPGLPEPSANQSTPPPLPPPPARRRTNDTRRDKPPLRVG